MIKNHTIPAGFLLPLISAVSVLRKEKDYKSLLLLAKTKKIPAGKLYETLLQTYLFAGFPAALISLKIFNDIFPGVKRNTEKLSLKELRSRGEKTCKRIYGEKYDKLISNVKSFSPELADWLVVEGYGKVLGREQLSLKERELSIIAILTVLKFQDQLFSHLKGALKLGIKENKIKRLMNLLAIINSSYSSFGLRVLKKLSLQMMKNTEIPL